MPRVNKVLKKPMTIALTHEAWAILGRNARAIKISKNDYLENLVRRGDAVLYDVVTETLIAYYVDNKRELEQVRKALEIMEKENESIRDLLKIIGVSPNLIP